MDERAFEQRGEKEREYFYDAVFIDSGGLSEAGGKFYPTDYRPGDEFGMLGGGIRLVAAVDLYLNTRARRFIFMTGLTEKNKARLGPDVPTEASVLGDKFQRVLAGLQKRSDYQGRFDELEEPIVEGQERSYNTLTNIEEALKAVQSSGYKRICFLSSNYHIPRYRALWDMVLKSKGIALPTEIDFIGAEDVVKELEPGKYDEVIDKAYKTEAAKQRIENEERGVRDIAEGRYAYKEFQLDERSKGKD